MRIVTPETLDDALTMLADDPALTPIAGGTDLLVHWPGNLDAKARDYLDLSRLRESQSAIRWEDDRVMLGALTTYWDVVTDKRFREEFPILIEAARQVGAVQIQTRGTWAGNIVNASPVADGVPALMACGADVELRSASGPETIPLETFYTGYRQTRRRPEQLVTGVTLPAFVKDRLTQTPPAAGGEEVIRVTFAGTHATDPMLARLTQEMGIPVNILAGAVEEIGTRPFGNLLVSMPVAQAAQARAFLEQHGLLTEVLGYVG